MERVIHNSSNIIAQKKAPVAIPSTVVIPNSNAQKKCELVLLSLYIL